MRGSSPSDYGEILVEGVYMESERFGCLSSEMWYFEEEFSESAGFVSF